jgi:cytochrome bd-type quinol oxidase subunit 2
MTTASQGMPSTERQEISLNDAATHVLEECRTVVPGMQALFGFQLIAVFNAAFKEQLSSSERMMHLAAIVLVTIAIVLVMAPAALHRQTEPEAVSRRFITISSRLLMASMAPLAIGICLDVYLVARIIADSRGVAGIVGVSLLAVFVVFWLLLPRVVRRGNLKPVSKT